MSASPRKSDVTQTAQDLLRAVGGGLFVGLPLLFTLEMWAHSFLIPSWKIVLLLLVSFLVVIGYSAVSGFRRERTWRELLVDSLETMGIAMVVATVALFLLGRIGLETGLRDAIGKVALEAIPVAFGVSLASTQLASSDDEAADAEKGSAAGDGAGTGTLGRLIVAAGGALVFALNVAPTEEPMLLGVEAPWWLLGLVAVATMAMTLAIVFYADFRGGRARDIREGALDHPISETLAAYAISLLVSLLLLWSFGRTEGATMAVIAGQMIMLAVLASFGAAAGRLLLGGGSPNREQGA